MNIIPTAERITEIDSNLEIRINEAKKHLDYVFELFPLVGKVIDSDFELYKVNTSNYYLVLDCIVTSIIAPDISIYSVDLGLDKLTFKDIKKEIRGKIILYLPDVRFIGWGFVPDYMYAIYVEKGEIEFLLKQNPDVLEWFHSDTLFLACGRCIRHDSWLYRDIFGSDYYHFMIDPYSIQDALDRWQICA